MTFPILSDPDLRIAKAYGVRQRGLNLSLPATFVVDSTGTIRFVRVAANPIDRPATADVLRALREAS